MDDRLAAENYAYLDTLTAVSLEALQEYRDEEYAEINGYLRGQEHEEEDLETIETKVDLINEVLRNAPALPFPLVVYRGIRPDMLPPIKQQQVASLQVGDEVDLMGEGFTSTSTILENALAFANNDCCVFALHLSSGTRGLYIGGYFTDEAEQDEDYDGHGEGEFLLPPGLLFEVEGVELVEGGVRLYHLAPL